MPIATEKLTANCNVARIVQGESFPLLVEVFDSISGQALDLTAMTTATATLPGTSGDVVLTGTATGDAGRLSFPMSTANSGALKVGDAQSWQVSLSFTGGNVRIVQLLERLDVAAALE